MRYIFLLLLIVLFPYPATAGVEMSRQDGMGMGIPIGGENEVDFDICPQGARTVGMFLTAWYNNDYQTMYQLLDDESKKGYLFEQARLDFEVLKFKPYKVSSIRKSGENFEFILSYGSWEDGDKEMEKMLISGTTFKIIMLTKKSPFKKSVDNYF